MFEICIHLCIYIFLKRRFGLKSMDLIITSESNGQIKELIKLQKQARERRKTKKFVAEGIKMVLEAINFDKLDKLYVSESAFDRTAQRLGDKLERIPYEVVADNVFKQISDTVTPQGVLATVNMPEYDVKEILSDERKAWVLLDDLRDPGNLGTIIRTSEGAGMSGVIMSKESVDLFNPKVVRSTMGAIFRVKFCYVESLIDIIEEIKKSGYDVYATAMEGSEVYDCVDYTKGSAFIIGNEANGVSDAVFEKASKRIRIPMEGKLESLNAAVSAAIIMYEMARQKRK